MNPQKYLEYDTNLLIARAEEYLGRCWADKCHAEALALNWSEKPFAQQHVVTEGNPIYPWPPDNSPAPPDSFTWYWRRAKMKPVAGGVIQLDDGMLEYTQPKTLSDGTAHSVDYEADGKTWEQLSQAARDAIVPPGDI